MKMDDPHIPLTLSEQDAEAATRILKRLLNHFPPSPSLVALDSTRARSSADQKQYDRQTLVSAARKAYLERRLRNRYFPGSMFGEPAWDMLVSLYCVSDTVGSMTIGRTIAFSDVPNTTGLRWIDYLEKHSYLQRRDAPLDGRSVLVSLTEKAFESLDSYFTDWLNRGDLSS